LVHIYTIEISSIFSIVALTFRPSTFKTGPSHNGATDRRGGEETATNLGLAKAPRRYGFARAGMTALRDLSGQRFHHLVVIERDQTNSKAGRARWLCRCDCGAETVVSGNNLPNGSVKSCGCLRMSPDKLPKGSAAEVERAREVALFTEHFKTVGQDKLPDSLLPKRGKGRQNAREEALYSLQINRFCDRMLQIRSQLDF
jgi:hypothetical protein